MTTSAYKLFRLYGYPGIALLLYLIMFLINPYERTFEGWRLYSTMDFVLDGLVTVGYATVIFETGIQLTLKLNRGFPWDRNVRWRFVVQFLLHISIISTIFFLFFQIRFPDKFGYDQLQLRQAVVLGIVFSLLTTTVFAAEHFFYNLKDARLQASEMKQYAVQAQLDALKLQLDPHFLFNNLSTLVSLIEENPALAVNYTVNLASIYRYMLANRTQNIIPLGTELEFIKAYSFLYHVRYGDGIDINISDNVEFKRTGIAPLTLQLLIENAIKHNLFSSESPLIIDICFLEGKWIVVKNNKRPKPVKESGSHMGLKNIRQRYLLLGQREPVIIDEMGTFSVMIPLLM
jgi:hypothetical protein